LRNSGENTSLSIFLSTDVNTRGDTRGVAIQVGAILLFAMLIIAFSLYQATIVPAQSERVELRHSEAVQHDFQDVRNGIIRTADEGGTHPTSVDLGAQYPRRTFLVNPAPHSGSLRTAGTMESGVNVTIENATSPTSGNVGAFWNGRGANYSTGALTYRPDYNVYSGAPTTVYEHSVVYNRYEGTDGGNRTLAKTSQSIVQGHRISLVALRGSLSESASGDLTVRPRSLSASTTEVALESTAASPLRIELPTRLNEAAWNRALDREASVTMEYTRRTGDRRNLVALVFDPGVYELSLSKVGVGAVLDAGTDPAYVVETEGGDGLVAGDRLAVEVRDRYNNPVAGERVEFTVDGTTHTRISGADGVAAYTLGGSATAATASLRNASEAYESVEFDAGDASGDTGGGSTGTATLDGAVQLNRSGPQFAGSNAVDLELNNTGTSEVNVTHVRIGMYYDTNSSKRYTDALVENDFSETVAIRDGFTELSTTFPILAGSTRNFTLSFTTASGDAAPIEENDYFVTTLAYDNGETDTYHVNPIE
jgi:hypothetical protein